MLFGYRFQLYGCDCGGWRIARRLRLMFWCFKIMETQYHFFSISLSLAIPNLDSLQPQIQVYFPLNLWWEISFDAHCLIHMGNEVSILFPSSLFTAAFEMLPICKVCIGTILSTSATATSFTVHLTKKKKRTTDRKLLFIFSFSQENSSQFQVCYNTQEIFVI